MYNVRTRKFRRLVIDRVLCQKDSQLEEGLELFHAPKGTNKKWRRKGLSSIFRKSFSKIWTWSEDGVFYFIRLWVVYHWKYSRRNMKYLGSDVLRKIFENHLDSENVWETDPFHPSPFLGGEHRFWSLITWGLYPGWPLSKLLSLSMQISHSRNWGNRSTYSQRCCKN